MATAAVSAPPPIVASVGSPPPVTATVAPKPPTAVKVVAPKPPAAPKKVGVPGPRGPEGQRGEAGPPGETGAAGARGPVGGTATFRQTNASKVWLIPHMLSFRPGGVHCRDDYGRTMRGYVTHPDENTTQIEFEVAVSGYADLS